ncbi:Ldh family oxidoreductase [Acidobacterium sp. S8]|uniref:Ldh family oxidoreductase n=1 Tax=Acidobacterium sp. S8 TaxID=1641854 RepID=UPI0021107B41|nr:Ldh family oxidoreductase [Acidobacterium sp. S8]
MSKKTSGDRRIAVQKLNSFCVEVLMKAGLTTANAKTTADVLVMTDTWGTFSHGTGALLNYTHALQAGGIDRSAQPEVLSEGPSWAIIDGRSGRGMPSCCMAMNLAIEKARTCTIAWTGVRNGSHFGEAGYYANLAADQNVIGIAMSNADPNMTIPGTRGHTIGNNPLAYAVPAGKERPILLDIALSAVAYGKITAMKTQGQSIPLNWITDTDGLPTNDLSNWPATGSMMPMAGHKGYGIAILVEVLAGLMTGAGLLGELKSWVFTPGEKASLGQGFIAINVGALLPVESFQQRVDSLIRQLRQAPKAKGSDRIYVPGEIEWERREDCLRNGIPLPAAVLASLYRAGEERGVDPNLLD